MIPGAGMQLGQKRLADGDRLPFRVEFNQIGFGASVVPADSVQLVITIIGNGGGGARTNGAQSYGGGGGAKSTRTIVIDPADWGGGVLWEIRDPGYGRSGSIGNGSDALGVGISIGVDNPPFVNYTGSMSCNGAKGGTTTAAGAGGAAIGGDVNTPGLAGAQPKGGNSADGILGGQSAGADGGTPGGGGAGGLKAFGVQSDGGDGGLGCIILEWS